MSARFWLMLCFLVRSSEAQVDGRAELRQEVPLTCRAPNNEHLDPDNQDPSYRNRVDLQDKHLKIRDVSLVLKNVKLEDRGTYECQIAQKGTISMIRISLNNETISSSDPEGHQPAQVNITAGQDVTLPCKAPNNNKTVTGVEWTRPELDPEYVLFYRDGHLDPHDQHPSYRNRVDLQDRQMKDGDVSLVLKDVKMEDTGTYECRVFLEGTNGLKNDPIIRIINLEVLEPGDKVGQSGDGGEKGGGDKNKIIIGSVVGVILAVIPAGGFLIYKRLKRQKSHRPVLADEAADDQMS